MMPCSALRVHFWRAGRRERASGVLGIEPGLPRARPTPGLGGMRGEAATRTRRGGARPWPPEENLQPTSLHPAAARPPQSRSLGTRCALRHFRGAVLRADVLPVRYRACARVPAPGAGTFALETPGSAASGRVPKARRGRGLRGAGRRTERRRRREEEKTGGKLSGCSERVAKTRKRPPRRGTVADGGHAACRRSLRVMRARRVGKWAGRGRACLRCLPEVKASACVRVPPIGAAEWPDSGLRHASASRAAAR